MSDPLVQLVAALSVRDGRDATRPAILINEGGRFVAWIATPLPDGRTQLHACFPTRYIERVRRDEDLTVVDVTLPAGLDVSALRFPDPS